MLALAGGGEEVGELLEGSREELGLGPEIRGEERVGAGQSIKGSLDEVAEGLGATSGGGEAIVDSGIVEYLLGHTTSDDASSAGSGHKTHVDGTAMARHLHRHGVGHTDFVTPITTAHGHNVELGVDDRSADSGGDFLGALDSETDVTVGISDDDKCLKAGTLTGTCLLLHGGDLHHLILELGAEEVVEDLELLDGEREEVDVLKRLDLSALHEASELGHGDPIALLTIVLAAARTTATTAAISTITTVTTVATTTTSSTSESFTKASTSTFCHCFFRK